MEESVAIEESEIDFEKELDPSRLSSTLNPIEYQGFLKKQQNGGLKRWQTRHFVIDNTEKCVHYSKVEGGAVLKKIPFSKIKRVEQCKDALGIPIARFNMELHEDSELGSDSGRIYHLEAESVKICREWIDAIEFATESKKTIAPSLLAHSTKYHRARTAIEINESENYVKEKPKSESMSVKDPLGVESAEDYQINEVKTRRWCCCY